MRFHLGDLVAERSSRGAWGEPIAERPTAIPKTRPKSGAVSS